MILVLLSSMVGQPTNIAKADTPAGKYDWHLINVSADNYFSETFLPVNTIDDDPDNVWLNDINDTLPTSIWYEFPAEETLSKIGLWQTSYTEPWSYRLRDYEVFVSTDGTNWTSVASNTGVDVPHAYQETSFTPVVAKYVKITAKYPSWEDQTYQTYDTKNWIGLDGFQAYDQNGDPLINSAPLLLPRYTLTINISGNGSVNPPGGTYNEGAVVQLEAVPGSNWNFGGWSGGGLSGNTNPASITMDADKTVTATFTETVTDCYTLTLVHTGQGNDPVADPVKSEACSTNGQYVANETITLSGAGPTTGWEIDHWTGTNNNSSTASTNTVTMPANAHTVSVVYVSTDSPVPTPAVAVHVSEATAACWNSLGGPHNDWKYWHIYGFLMESLNSDGTPYVVVSDDDIAAGTLLSGAKPKYPILISLAAACISDETANEIKEFVQAGGHVYVGSTSWTRDESGALRGASGASGKYDWHLINVSADNYFSGTFLPVNTIDDDPDNVWLNDINDTLPTSIWYEFPAEETLSKIGLWQTSYTEPWSYRLRDYEVFVSTDGTNWTSVASNTGVDVPHAYQETSFTPVVAKYVKITAKYPSWEDQTYQTYDTKNWIGLDGFQAYDQNGDPLINSAPLLSTSSTFALSTEMGLIPEGTGLIGTIQKVANDPIVSHLRETDVRNWLLPKAYTNTGYTYPSHWAQFVSATDATVLLTSDGHPTLALKDYGAGRFIYHSEFSPLAGYSGYVVDNFEYGFFRNAIEQAFKANEVPLIRLSGWPYPYNAAFKTRHDHFLRKAASDVEAAYNVKGEWLLRTSAAIGGPDWGYLSDIQANGALIGSHTLNEYTLDSGGYSAAYSNINQSLNDLSAQLGARPQIFVGPGMMAFRDTSLQAIVNNGIKTTGDMSHGPYPNFALKIDTATDYGQNAHWPLLEIPVSRYYALPGETWGNLIYSHIGSMNLTDELAYIEKTVDLTYDLGGVINLYDHVGDIGSLWIHPDVAPFEHYISYSLSKPYVWNTDPLRIYDWWIKRDAVSITPSVSYPSQNQTQVNITVSGPSDQGPFALDIAIPDGKGVNQVRVNGNSSSAYRIEGQKLKVNVPAPAQVEVLFGAPVSVSCYTLTLDHTGQGSNPVASPANSTGCSTGQYTAGEIVTLSGVNPASGQQIGGWTGTNDDSSQARINTVTMPASAHTAAVNYTVPTCYALTISHAGQGSDPVSSPANSTGCSVGQYIAGETISLSGAAPDTGWQISGWAGTNNNSSISSSNTVTMPASAHSASVTYTVAPLDTTITGQPSNPMPNAEASFSFTSTKAGSTFECKLDSGSFSVCTSPNTYTALSNGIHTFLVRAINGSEVDSTPASYTWIVNASLVDTVIIADTTVLADSPTTNYGSTTQVVVDNSPVKNMLLKFTVSGIGTRTVENAKLLLYCVDGSSVGGVFYRVANTTWDEGTVNWNNAPAADANSFATLGAVTAGNWYEVDITSLVTGDGTFSLKATSTSSNGAHYSTKEATSGHAPQVIVTTSSGPVPTVTIDQAASQSDPTNLSPIHFTAVFSEEVTGFDGADVALSGTAGATTAVVSGGPISYDVAVSGMTGDGIVIASIPAGVALDASNNGNTASTSTDNSITYNLPPNCYALTLSQTGQGESPVASPANSTGCSAGQYVVGATINLSGAVPDAGWHIGSWNGTANDTSTASNNSLTMPASARTVSVNYIQNEYTLTIISAYGTVTKNPNKTTYHYGDVVQLTAVPAAGWSFANWTGDATGTSNPVSITINGNKAVTANYTQIEYTLSITSAHGTVTKNPDKATYHYGDVVQLTVVPAAGWYFVNWTGDATGSSNPVSITINGNKAVTASYTQLGYTLTIESAHGTVTRNPDKATYQYGEVVQLTAAPATGWSFANWSGDATGTSNPVSITMDGNKAVTANYTQNAYTLTVTSGHGTVTKSPDKTTYSHGEVVQLTATADHDWLFVSWTGDVIGTTNPISVTMDGNKTITANFMRSGADTTGVFRPMNGIIFLKNTNETGFADVGLNYGIPGDYPVVGDWDGNGTTTIGVYRNGKFYLRNSNTVGFADVVFAFGQPGDQPVAGDWDGDGVDTIGVYRPSIGLFLLRNSNSSGSPDMSFYLGNVGDVGIAGDWDGDGKDTTGVFRPSNGVIFLKNTNETGFADVALNYGIPGDKPVIGDWDNDGMDTIGVYRNGQFMLRNSNTVGFAEIVFGLGNPGDMPIAGNWDGLP